MAVVREYYRVSRANKLLKVVREHYLRDDVCCGLKNCKLCAESKGVIEPENVGQSPSSVLNKRHLLILDTHLLLHEMDVLEEEPFKNILLCQTVVDEVKRRSSAMYARMRQLLSNPDRHIYLFHNEFSVHTFVERKPHESADDRNDRALRRVCEWFKEHMNSNGFDCDVVFLTNDEANVEKFRAAGLLAFTLRDYVQGMTAATELLERMAAQRLYIGGRAGCTLFEEYLPIGQIKCGLANGTLRQGVFNVSRENYLEANVHITTKEVEENVFVQGLLHCNRAINNDIVVVEVLPADQWSCPASVLKLQELQKDEGDEVDDEEDRRLRLDVAKKKGDLLPTGKVVGVIKRNWRPVCAMLQSTGLTSQTRHLAVPADKRIPWIRIETRQADRLLGQRIVVAIDSWPVNSRYPLGHFVNLLGPAGDKETENEVILLEHEIRHHDFGSEILACLPQAPWAVGESDLLGREDLRHLHICSIDPPGCTDIDDALHCVQLANGHFEVGVHIADVSHFVGVGSALDDEAALRGTTVYLVDRRIDMLPQLLSSNICSLLPMQDRLTFSVIWQLDAQGNVVSKRFCKSVIKSRVAFTYAEAQCRIDDKAQTDQLTLSLRHLNGLAKALKQKRKEKGALTLASMEIRFSIDTESRDPIDVVGKQSLETNSLVEEFMLLANITVAERLLVDFADAAILRRHPVAPAERFSSLVKAAAKRGFQVVVDKGGKALADSLDTAVLQKHPYFNTMLRILTTRCMATAVYFCSGTVARNQYFHYGLAAPVYTHFTSPIRRYADLMVHRLLAASIDRQCLADSRLVDRRRIELLCDDLNYRHKMAQYAGRASVLLNTHLLFKSRVEDVEGYVLLLRRNAIQVLMPKFGLEAAILLNRQNTQYTYDDVTETITFADSTTLRMFDPVKVQLSIDDRDAQRLGRLKLHLVQPYVEGFSVAPIVETNEEDQVPLKKLRQ